MGRHLAVPLASSGGGTCRFEYGRNPVPERFPPLPPSSPPPRRCTRSRKGASPVAASLRHGSPRTLLWFSGSAISPTPQRFRPPPTSQARDPAPGCYSSIWRVSPPFHPSSHPPLPFRSVSRLAHRAYEPRHLILDGTRAPQSHSTAPRSRYPRSGRPVQACSPVLTRASPAACKLGTRVRTHRDATTSAGHSASTVRPKRAICTPPETTPKKGRQVAVGSAVPATSHSGPGPLGRRQHHDAP